MINRTVCQMLLLQPSWITTNHNKFYHQVFIQSMLSLMGNVWQCAKYCTRYCEVSRVDSTSLLLYVADVINGLACRVVSGTCTVLILRFGLLPPSMVLAHHGNAILRSKYAKRICQETWGWNRNEYFVTLVYIGPISI